MSSKSVAFRAILALTLMVGYYALSLAIIAALISIAGREHTICGLSIIYGVSDIFTAYWRNEVAPVLGSGFGPSIINGFDKYLLI